MNCVRRSLWVCLLALAAVGRAGGIEFTAGPRVEKDGDKMTISFELAGSTDVEVAVLDAEGAVVRHLAAGKIGIRGETAPPLGRGLEQELTWDGRDDLGKPAKGGPFKVRVRAGLWVEFDGVIGDRRVMSKKVYGIATDADGHVYVATGLGVKKDVPTVKVFDRDGKYLRTIMPFPPTLKASDIKGFGEPRVGGGRLMPRQYGALSPILYPDGVTGFVGGKERSGVLWLTNGRGRLCAIRAKDGACIRWGGGRAPASPHQGPICWGVSPDGKRLYLAGWYIWFGNRKRVKDGGIFKVDPETGEREPFVRIDVPKDSFWLNERNGWYNYTNWGRKNGVSAIHGLAVDKDGRVYACDRVNQRIAVYSPEGKLLGSTPVKWPDHVALSPKGDAVYVTTRRVVDGYKAVNEVKVLKLSGWKNGEVLAELTLQSHNAPSMAVDATEEPAVIWLSNVAKGKAQERRPPKTRGVFRIEDRGDEFVITGVLNDDLPPLPVAVVKVWADPMSDDIITSDGWSGLNRFDGETGETTRFPLRGMDLAFGPEGSIHVYGQKGWHELVTRFTRELKPGTFPATGKTTTTMAATGKDVYGRYGHGWCNKGLAVSPRGRIFVYNMYDWAKYYLNVWDETGKAETHDRVNHSLVGPLDAEGGGVRVDFPGNVYVGLHGVPATHKLKRRRIGTVVKFPPTGGGYVTRDLNKEGREGGLAWKGSDVGNFVEGATTVYPQLGPQVNRGCVCKEARFDLDGYGRLYVPNGLDYCVRIYDNAGNELVRFGHYGNADTCGPESAVPEPAIGLGWPVSVAAGHIEKGRLYVADTLNARVVRLKPVYAAEATEPID
ncbi:MAG: hypothetical protein ACOC8E_05220 [Planctomycetota bacterium]